MSAVKTLFIPYRKSLPWASPKNSSIMLYFAFAVSKVVRLTWQHSRLSPLLDRNSGKGSSGIFTLRQGIVQDRTIEELSIVLLQTQEVDLCLQTSRAVAEQFARMSYGTRVDHNGTTSKGVLPQSAQVPNPTRDRNFYCALNGACEHFPKDAKAPYRQGFIPPSLAKHSLLGGSCSEYEITKIMVSMFANVVRIMSSHPDIMIFWTTCVPPSLMMVFKR